MNINISGMDKDELARLIEDNAQVTAPEILETARSISEQNFGKTVYMRGLIEFTNHCKNDCLYCGIRKSACGVTRYRLTKEQILDCCEKGYELGFRTFVLQGGEDSYYNTDRMCGIINAIRVKYPDCAITLSFGEHSAETYKSYFESGANRYLLRHESASPEHYARLHPSGMTLESRKECLYSLKELGFQVGAGFMVGSPHQTYYDLAEDLLFLKEFKPHMVGIGPFVPSAATPFKDFTAGTLQMTILMIALTRILLPDALLPATTALATIRPNGREAGLRAGGNVVMPNLSPAVVRGDYSLYDNKVYTHGEAAESVRRIEVQIRDAGFELSMARGDHKSFKE